MTPIEKIVFARSYTTQDATARAGTRRFGSDTEAGDTLARVHRAWCTVQRARAGCGPCTVLRAVVHGAPCGRAPRRRPVSRWRLKLYLVHHADAVGPHVDPQRPLSSLGRQQADDVAAKLASA